MTIQQLREKHKHTVDKATALLKLEDLSSDRIDEVEALTAEAEKIGAEIRLREHQLQTAPLGSRNTGEGLTELSTPGGVLHMLGSSYKLTDYVAQRAGSNAPHPDQVCLGKWLKGKITGDWRNADAELALASQSEGDNVAGGYLVPTQLSSRVLDKARANAVLFAAGANIIPMGSDEMRIATIETDPTLQHKQENAAFDTSTIVFGSKNLISKTWGQVIVSSRELWDDASNMADIVEQTLARALAVKLDYMGLQGTGLTGQLMGIENYTGVNEITSVGAIAHEDLAEAVRKVEDENGVPTAVIMSPKTREDLSILTSGDGSTAAKTWLGFPATVVDLPRYSTTSCPDASTYVGDFRQAVYGIRLRPEIRVTDTGGDTFNKFQVAVRIVWRGDFALLRPTHFTRLLGITH